MQSLDVIQAMIPVGAELERLGVKYYVGGSVATTVYGHMRMTQDVDLVANMTLEHAVPLVDALKDRYYVNLQAVSDAIVRRRCFNLIHLATSFKVDIFVVKDRRYDQVALQRIQKKPFNIDNPAEQFFVASAEDIILSKLEWFRLGDEVSERQWRDVIGVLKIQENLLDRSYLEKWAAELGIADLLEKAWKEI